MAFIIQPAALAETTGVFYDNTVEQIKFPANIVQTDLAAKGYRVEMLSMSLLSASYANKKVVIALKSNSEVTMIKEL